jgi:hypothetical protein
LRLSCAPSSRRCRRYGPLQNGPMHHSRL